jgi:hypothetical protein
LRILGKTLTRLLRIGNRAVRDGGVGLRASCTITVQRGGASQDAGAVEADFMGLSFSTN